MVDEKVSDSFLSILLDLLIKLNIFSLHIGQENSVFKKIQLWTSLLDRLGVMTQMQWT